MNNYQTLESEILNNYLVFGEVFSLIKFEDIENEPLDPFI